MTESPKSPALAPVTVEQLAQKLQAENERWRDIEPVLDDDGVLRYYESLAQVAIRALIGNPASKGEPVDWHWRHKDPHEGAPWSDWKRIRGTISEFRELWKDNMVGNPAKVSVELRPLYASRSNPQDTVQTYTEICMNEKCPRGQGVAVEVVRPVTSTKSTWEDRRPDETGDEYEARIGKLVVGRPVSQTDEANK